MVNQSTITSNIGARKGAKRIGRGNSGSGGTYGGRGNNGQNSRSGGGVHTLFEGGQSQLHVRLPKLKGFNRTLKRPYTLLNLDELEKHAALGELTRDVLLDKHILKKGNELKILGRGKITTAVTVHAAAASATAIKAIEKAGGKVILEALKNLAAKTKRASKPIRQIRQAH